MVPSRLCRLLFHYSLYFFVVFAVLPPDLEKLTVVLLFIDFISEAMAHKPILQTALEWKPRGVEKNDSIHARETGM